MVVGQPVDLPVNLADALSTAEAHGADPAELAAELTARGLLGGAVIVEPFTTADAIEAARLGPLTRAAGLSLGDRACLALARRQGATAITVDSARATLGLGIDVRPIR
jgi:PIN domain nuclease of toxin-antitoxin system